MKTQKLNLGLLRKLIKEVVSETEDNMNVVGNEKFWMHIPANQKSDFEYDILPQEAVDKWNDQFDIHETSEMGGPEMNWEFAYALPPKIHQDRSPTFQKKGDAKRYLAFEQIDGGLYVWEPNGPRGAAWYEADTGQLA